MAENRTRINCLEGSYADHYTTNAFWKRERLVKWIFSSQTYRRKSEYCLKITKPFFFLRNRILLFFLGIEIFVWYYNIKFLKIITLQRKCYRFHILYLSIYKTHLITFFCYFICCKNYVDIIIVSLTVLFGSCILFLPGCNKQNRRKIYVTFLCQPKL